MLPYRDTTAIWVTAIGIVAVVYTPFLEPLKEYLIHFTMLGIVYVVRAGKPSGG